LMAVYYASKAYVLSFSEAIASELKRTGVTVTALCPGPTITEFQKRAGIAESGLFQSGLTMDSMTVARIGYRAMMRGKRVAVAGMRNKLMAFSTRFAPRSLLASAVKKLNETR
jgi:short-subunit dehydrogenase